MIHKRILELKTEVEACCGKVVRVTLDKKGIEALENELPVTMGGITTIVFGILIDQAEKCPTCGQNMKE